MAHTELDVHERVAIQRLMDANEPVAKIARQIGRHRSTVYREIRRNAFCSEELSYLNGYYGVVAHKTAQDRRTRRRKLVRLEALRHYVIDRLTAGWTPEQIAGRLTYDGHALRVSHETIYAYVYSKEGQSERLAAISPAAARNAGRVMPDAPEARFFRRIGPSINAPRR